MFCFFILMNCYLLISMCRESGMWDIMNSFATWLKLNWWSSSSQVEERCLLRR